MGTSMAAPLILVKASLHDVTSALDNGSVTSEHLVTEYLSEQSFCQVTWCSLNIDTERIEADNIRGLGLRAVLETAPGDLGESSSSSGLFELTDYSPTKGEGPRCGATSRQDSESVAWCTYPRQVSGIPKLPKLSDLTDRWIQGCVCD